MNFVTPSGFRDVLAEEAAAREVVTRAVQDLFAARGYLPVETPTLEVMGVLEAGGRIPAAPFKFFDSRGDLLAMRPDVTLQVARLAATRLAADSGPLRLRYTQRVFREAESDAREGARELTQMGVECLGEQGPQADAEIIGLFAEALATAGVEEFSLTVATVAPLRALLDRSGAPEAWKAAVLDAYHASNFVELDRLTDVADPALADLAAGVAPAYAAAIRALPRIRGGRDAIEAARALTVPLGCADGLDDFERIYDLLAGADVARRVLVDFSAMSSFDYYTLASCSRPTRRAWARRSDRAGATTAWPPPSGPTAPPPASPSTWSRPSPPRPMRRWPLPPLPRPPLARCASPSPRARSTPTPSTRSPPRDST